MAAEPLRHYLTGVVVMGDAEMPKLEMPKVLLEMPMVLQWGLLVFVFCALVVSMSIASFTYARYLESLQVRNYAGNWIAMSGADTRPHATS